MSKKVSAAVYMELKVVVHVGSWDANQSFEQLHKQADREARNSLSNQLKNSSIQLTSEASIMKVVTTEENK